MTLNDSGISVLEIHKDLIKLHVSQSLNKPIRVGNETRIRGMHYLRSTREVAGNEILDGKGIIDLLQALSAGIIKAR